MSQKDLIKAVQQSNSIVLEQLIKADPELSMEAASFNGEHINALTIRDIDCSNTEWEACIFESCSFINVNLEGAFFNGCTFHSCTFSGNDLSEMAFDGCVMQRTKISSSSDIDGLEFSNSQLKDCVLEDLSFVDSNLLCLTISQGSIARLSGSATLKSVVLRSVEIDDFDTSDMVLTACTASGTDPVPEGFTAVKGNRRRV